MSILREEDGHLLVQPYVAGDHGINQGRVRPWQGGMLSLGDLQSLTRLSVKVGLDLSAYFCMLDPAKMYLGSMRLREDIS